jgi:hypothetical protein
MPERGSEQANILRLDGNRLLWNGREVSEANVRAFLDVTAKAMNPQPLLILSHSARTPLGRIQRARFLVDEAVRCNPGRCLEVAASSQ